MKPLALSFLVLSSIVLFAVLATCKDCHKQFDEEMKNSSSIRVFSWVKDIVKNSSSVFVDSLDNSSNADSLTELSDEDIEAMKRIIISSYGESVLADTVKDDFVFVDEQHRAKSSIRRIK